MGFSTTTHDRCIYRRGSGDTLILIIRQIDDFMIACIHEKTARDIVDTIGRKMQFDTEREQGIVPMEFLGIVNDYNGVEIKQTPYYIEMSCKNYINRFLRSHGWEEEEDDISNISKSTQEAAASLHRLEEAIEQEDLSLSPKLESSSKLLEEIRKDPMKVSNRSIPMPADCIEKIYKNSGPKEGTAHHKALEEKVGFAYQD